MILRSLRVAGWRCFVNAVEIGPLGDGLNVVHGPNGSGKSTLLWALARGLFDSYKVSGADVKSLVPWGREVNPCVRIEFEHGTTRYRIDKQFIGGQRADLSRSEAGKWVPLAAGAKADDFVRDLLSAEPHRGLSSAEHWGFAQVLWATQGALQIKELAGGIQNTIRDSLGAQVAGAGAEEIEAHAERDYATIFTPTGKLKGGSNPPRVVALQLQIAQKCSEREQIAAQLVAFDDAGQEIASLRAAQAQSQQQQVQLEAALVAADAAAQEYVALLHDRDLLREKVELAKSLYQQQQTRAQAIAMTRDELQRAATAETKLRDELTACDESLRQVQGERAAAHADAATWRTQRDELDRIQATARRAEQYVRDCAALDSLAAKLDEIAALQRLIDECSSARAKIVAPDAPILLEIKVQQQQRRDKRSLLSAALIRVTIEPLQPLSIDVSAGEKVGRWQLDPHQPHTLEGSPEVAFVIDGVGLIRAQGPAESAAELREQLRAIDERLARLTENLGTDDVALLDERVEQARRLDQETQHARQQLARLLGTQSPATLQSQRAPLEQALDTALASNPEWAAQPPDAQRWADAARQAADAHRLGEQASIERQTAAESAYNEQFRRRAQLSADLTASQRAAQTGEQRLCELTSDGLDDATRDARLSEAALAWRAEQAALQVVADKLAAVSGDPREIAQNLKQQSQTLYTATEQQQRQLIQAETRLQSIVEQGPYAKLADIDEALSSWEEEYAREQLRTSAIHLLRSTIQSQKTAAVSAIIEPVEHHANSLLRRIAGGQFETITIGDKLLPTGVRPRLHPEPVSLGYLSGGEQEQVHFAVRVALAEAAFGVERQLVVLDDAFTATDAARLQKIAEILQETAQRFQIVLLSCHPERYAHLQSVKFFDLAQLTKGKSEEHAA